ncbi:hypothetical protein GYH30_010339 [Glycine max]|nr:hypothetical protein GYH30_010339 [Glycine max]
MLSTNQYYSFDDPPIEDDAEIDQNGNVDTPYENQNTGYKDVGDPVWQCRHCKAMMWYDERINKDKQTKNPKFALCCGDGKIQLPVLQDAPQPLRQLLFDTNDSQAKNFQQNIRSYDVMFAFTSPSLQLDTRYNTGRGPLTFCLHGQGHHLIGSLLLLANKSPKFALLYIYDIDNEVNDKISQNPKSKPRRFRNVSMGDFAKIFNRSSSFIVRSSSFFDLHSNMLNNNNHYAQKFRMASDKLQSSIVSNLKLKLIYDRQSDGRLYNLPNTAEVAALIVGDEHTREDGYRPDIPHKDHQNIHAAKRKKVIMREYFCYGLQSRNNEAQTILHAMILFQQWIVDDYCMIESQKLNYVRQHQQQLRVDKYINLNACNNAPETLGNKKGKRVILPSSFVGSQRYMEQLYFDGMTICGHIGFPYLFLTLTCNLAWPEIQRKIFKMKLNQLMNDLKHGHLFGPILGFIYTIEWQKRGLPHAHILIFLQPANKYPNPEDIDKIISTEIPNKYTDPKLYEIVSKHMIHGPCGLPNRSTPCMVDGKCIRFFHKKFNKAIIVDQDGFPVYRRTNNGRTDQKHGIELDNRFVIPYSPQLLLKYRTHLNVEWCN